MSQEIESFFASYRDAYNRLDAIAVARHFALPSMLADRDCIVWAAEDQVSANMERLLASYRRGDYKQAEFIIDGIMAQGDDDAVVNVAWTIERHGGKPPCRFHTGYNLRRFGEGWRVILCTVYEERKARDGAS